MKKRIVLIISILFYVVMAVLSLTARKIHNANLPQVEVMELKSDIFYNEDGSHSFGVSLPKELYNDGVVYRVTTEIINKEFRYIARLAQNIEFGEENFTCYEVKDGLFYNDKIIISSLEGITDGCEVYIKEVN